MKLFLHYEEHPAADPARDGRVRVLAGLLLPAGLEIPGPPPAAKQLPSSLKAAAIQGARPVTLFEHSGINAPDMRRALPSLLAEFLSLLPELAGAKSLSITLNACFIDAKKRRVPAAIQTEQLDRSALAGMTASFLARQGKPPFSLPEKISFAPADSVSPRLAALCHYLTASRCPHCVPAAPKGVALGLNAVSAASDIIPILTRLLEANQPGVALILASQFKDSLSPAFQAEFSERCKDAFRGAPRELRRSQLEMVSAWVISIVDGIRDGGWGRDTAAWCSSRVLEPLTLQLMENGQSLDMAALRVRMLTADLAGASHEGRLAAAAGAMDALPTLREKLQGRWEYQPCLEEASIRIAVHLTDRFMFKEALSELRPIIHHYDALRVVYSSPRNQPLSSDTLGKALSTKVQVYLARGPQLTPEEIAAARKLSDGALSELTTPQDQGRHCQYRSQLEMLAGDFAAARSFLLAAAAPDSPRDKAPSWGTLTKALSGNPPGYSFLRLHFLRILFSELRNVEPKTRPAVFQEIAGQSIEILTARPASQEYPDHGILRRMAALAVLRGEPDAALAYLDSLRALGAVEGIRGTLVFVDAAAHLECAALLSERGHTAAASALLIHPETGLLARLTAMDPGECELMGQVFLDMMSIASDAENPAWIRAKNSITWMLRTAGNVFN